MKMFYVSIFKVCIFDICNYDRIEFGYYKYGIISKVGQKNYHKSKVNL